MSVILRLMILITVIILIAVKALDDREHLSVKQQRLFKLYKCVQKQACGLLREWPALSYSNSLHQSTVF